MQPTLRALFTENSTIVGGHLGWFTEQVFWKAKRFWDRTGREENMRAPSQSIFKNSASASWHQFVVRSLSMWNCWSNLTAIASTVTDRIFSWRVGTIKMIHTSQSILTVIHLRQTLSPANMYLFILSHKINKHIISVEFFHCISSDISHHARRSPFTEGASQLYLDSVKWMKNSRTTMGIISISVGNITVWKGHGSTARIIGRFVKFIC